MFWGNFEIIRVYKISDSFGFFSLFFVMHSLGRIMPGSLAQNSVGLVEQLDKVAKTRMHSSRMRTDRRLTVFWRIQEGGRCLARGGGVG